MNTKYLPSFELGIYALVYLCFLAYGIYEIANIKNETFMNSQDTKFTVGWSFLNRPRDNMDYEWESWKTFLSTHYFSYIVHMIVTEIFRKLDSQFILYFHIFFGVQFIGNNYSLLSLILISFECMSFVVLKHFRRKSILWINAGTWLILLNVAKQYDDEIMNFTELEPNQFYEILIIFSWNLLKLLSVSLDFVNTPEPQCYRHHSNNLLICFGYLFYFPNLLLGPVFIFRRYTKMIDNRKLTVNSLNDASERLQSLCFRFVRVLFWLYFTDFALHFIYITNLHYNPEIIKTLSPWALYAFGYLMGQFFYNKYIVSYGFSTMVAQFEGMPTPNLPKCIGRIHLYSDMWKYFDRGLYEFLFIYIYTATCTKQSSICRKLFASSIAFVFIYLWHGFYMFILIWSVLNFVCVHIEEFGRWIGKLIEKPILNRYLSQYNQRRFIGFCGAQLFIPAAMSNFYFSGGLEVGNIFFQRTYLNEADFYTYCCLCICCYCIYHTSEMIRRWEQERKIDKNDNNNYMEYLVK